MNRVRPARAADIRALDALIERSATRLSQGFYTAAETRAAIDHVFGVDSELVAEDESGMLLGCGGWSRRATLFGGDRYAARSLTFSPCGINGGYWYGRIDFTF